MKLPICCNYVCVVSPFSYTYMCLLDIFLCFACFIFSMVFNFSTFCVFLCSVFFWGGNYIQVRYLDFLDFGIQNVDQATPRVIVWKGNMIKLYSDFDFKSHHVFWEEAIERRFCLWPPSSNFLPFFSFLFSLLVLEALFLLVTFLGCFCVQGFDATMRPVIPFKLSPLSSDFKIGVHSQFAKSLQAEVCV